MAVSTDRVQSWSLSMAPSCIVIVSCDRDGALQQTPIETRDTPECIPTVGDWMVHTGYDALHPHFMYCSCMQSHGTERMGIGRANHEYLSECHSCLDNTRMYTYQRWARSLNDPRLEYQRRSSHWSWPIRQQIRRIIVSFSTPGFVDNTCICILIILHTHSRLRFFQHYQASSLARQSWIEMLPRWQK